MRLFLVLLPLLSAVFSSAQSPYIFTEEMRSYLPLQGGDTINAHPWNDECWNLSVPFELNIFGFNVNNWCAKEGTLRGFSSSSGDTTNFAISAYSADLMAADSIHAVSPIISTIEGIPGNRTLTIEFRNAHFEYLNGHIAYVNFQINYGERTRVIEFHYGPSEIDAARQAYLDRSEVFGGLIGLARGNSETVLEGLFLGGDPENVTQYDHSELMENFPESGTVYCFSPLNLSSGNPLTNDSCIEGYFRSANHDLVISTEASEIVLYSLNGQPLRVLKNKAGRVVTPLGTLPKGVLIIQAKGCQSSIKLVNF